MAKSGTITGSKVKNLWLTFEWNTTSTDVVSNTSTISWSLKLNSAYSLAFSADKTFSLSVNGTSYGGTFTNNVSWGNSGGSAVIKSGTTTIAHDADGSKSFNVNATFNIAVTISGTYVASISLSGTQPLDTIPRASTPTISPNTSVKTGDKVTINLNRASTSFTHALTYVFGKATGTIGESVGASTTWTIPRTFASQIPNSLSGVCVITCKTYSGTKLIGQTTVNLTIGVNTADVPSITSVTISEATPGLKEKFGAFIQNQSKLSVAIAASGVYGSTIKKYETKILNTTYDKASFTSGVISSSGAITISVTVTDSRNRSVSTTKTINVLPYTPPSIALFKCVRANSQGVEDSEGAYLNAAIRFNIEHLGNLNDKTYKVEYKDQNVESWTVATSGSVYSFDGSYVSAKEILDLDNPYTIRLTISDYFSSASYSYDVSTAFTLLDCHSSGTGLAIGKVSESGNLFDQALPALFRDSVHFGGKLTYDIPTLRQGSINDIVESGAYYLGNEVTDRPVAVNGWLEVRSYLGSYVYQKYITYTGRVFERIMTNNVWGDWCGLFNSGMWTYEKKLDGTVHMWGEFESSSIDFNVKVADSWYRPSTNFKLTYPLTFSKAPVVYFGNSLGVTAGSVLCYLVANTTTGASFWTQKMITGAATLKISVEVIGKWK